MTQQSLAAKAGTLSEGLKIPSVFQAPAQPIVARALAPYITFAHMKRADEWAKLTARFGQVLEGDMYLIERDGQTALRPLKCGWMCHQQYWYEANPTGEVLRASFDEKPWPYKEAVEAVVLCYLTDRIVPANILFKTTKCPAAKAMSDALAEATTSEWGEKSAAHKETLVCMQGCMRFYGSIDLGPQRTSKKSGLPYRTTTCAIQPTSLTEWRLLQAFCDGEDTQEQLEAAATRFQERVAEIKAKLR